MPVIHSVTFDAYVVATAVLDGLPVFALGDGTVRIVNGDTVTKAPLHKGAILAATLHPDGKTLLTGGDDGKLMGVRSNGASAMLAERPRKWIDQIATGPNDLIAFAGGRQATVITANGTEVRTFDSADTITGLAFAPKGARLAIAHRDGVTLWWINTGSAPTKLVWKGGQSNPTFSPDGRFLMTVMQENSLHGWQLPQATDLRMSGYQAKPKSLSWSARGRFLATSGADSAVLWPFHYKDGPLDKTPLQRGARGGPFITRVACHPTRDDLACGYRDGAVVVGPIGEGPDGTYYRQPDDVPVSALSWDPTGTWLVFGTETGEAGWVDFRN